jgi:transposase
LAGQGIMVGRSSVDRFLKALGMTRKKRHSTPPSRLVPTSPKPGSRGGSPSRS